MKRVIAILTVFLSTTLLAAPKQIKVGVMLRFDDAFNQSTSNMYDGIEIARDIFNKEHPDLQIVLTKYSHTKDPENILNVADKAIKDGMQAVIGGEMSNESMIMAEKFDQGKVIFMTPTSTNPKVLENKQFAFRACFSDAQVAKSMAKLAVDNLKAGRIGVLHNTSYPYSDFLTKTFIAEVNRLDPKREIVTEKFIRDQLKFEEPIAKFKKEKVTHLILLSYEGDLIRVFSEASRQSYFPTYIGSDGWGAPESALGVVKNQNDSAKFIGFLNTYWNSDKSGPAFAKFLKGFRKKFKQEPTPPTVVSYDAATVVFTAIAKAKDPTDALSVRDALMNTTFENLLTSKKFKYDETHSPDSPIFIYKISKSGVKFYKAM